MRALLTKLVAIVLGVGLLASAGQALACNTGCAPPAPPSPPHNPTPPNMPCTSCGGGGNVNVNVNVSASATATANANSGASAFGSAAAATYYGGYGNWSQSQGIPQAAGGLQIETGDEGMAESYSEQQSMTSLIALEASCIDDTGTPHPASQLGPDRNVDNSYVGELYRCIAGTHMQWTLVDLACGNVGGQDSGFVEGERSAYSRQTSSQSSSYSSSSSSRESRSSSSSYGSRAGNGYADGHADSYSVEHRSDFGGGRNGASNNAFAQCHANLSHISFDGGKTSSCQKGEALWFEHGRLSCKVQLQQRPCNERSLLRRFGAGIKILTVTRMESVTRQRQVSYQKSTSNTSVMTFDGGVGGFVQ